MTTTTLFIIVLGLLLVIYAVYRVVKGSSKDLTSDTTDNHGLVWTPVDTTKLSEEDNASINTAIEAAIADAAPVVDTPIVPKPKRVRKPKVPTIETLADTTSVEPTIVNISGNAKPVRKRVVKTPE